MQTHVSFLFHFFQFHFVHSLFFIFIFLFASIQFKSSSVLRPGPVVSILISTLSCVLVKSLTSLSYVSLRVIILPPFLPLPHLNSLLRPARPLLRPPPTLLLRHPCASLRARTPFFITYAPSPRLPAKRKALEDPDSSRDDVPSSSKDFEAGRVTCEACGESVSYRDERTGVFTTKHWDAHKLGWFACSLCFISISCPTQSSLSPPAQPLPPLPRPPRPLNHMRRPLVPPQNPAPLARHPSADGLSVPKRSVRSTFVQTLT